MLVVERESTAGRHSTGRSAAILRLGFNRSGDHELGLETRRVLLDDAASEAYGGASALRRCGSLNLAGGPDGRARLEAEAARLSAFGLDVRVVSAERGDPPVARGSAGSTYDCALLSGDDGILDVHGLLEGLLRAARAAGGAVRLGHAATRLTREGDRITGVEVDGTPLRAPLVVDAAGGWGDALAATADLEPLGLRPCRRHLMVTPPLADVDPLGPVVWDVDSVAYYRPESGGLLFSGCDEDLVGPCDPSTDDAAMEAAMERVVASFPALEDVGVAHAWAGLRTLSPDGRPLVGFDPRVEGLFWCAGLGGHGICASVGLRRLVGELGRRRGADLDRPGRAGSGPPAGYPDDMSERPIRVWMDELRVAIDAALDAALPPVDETPPRLHEAMRYSRVRRGQATAPDPGAAGPSRGRRRGRRRARAVLLAGDDPHVQPDSRRPCRRWTTTTSVAVNPPATRCSVKRWRFSRATRCSRGRSR